MAKHAMKSEYRVTGTAQGLSVVTVDQTTYAFSAAQAITQVRHKVAEKLGRKKVFWVGYPTVEPVDPRPDPLPVRPRILESRGKPNGHLARRLAPQQLGLAF